MHAHLPKTSPRPKHLLRKTLLLTTPLLALLTLRLFWGYHADHRLTALKSQLRTQGIEFSAPMAEIPDDQNAVLPLLDAIQTISLSGEERELVMNFANPDLKFTEDRTKAQRILSRIEPAIQKLAQAQARPKAQWPQRTPMMRVWPLGPLLKRIQNDAYEFHSLLGAAAWSAHEDHRDVEAFSDVTLMLSIARILDSDPTTSTHLMAAGTRKDAADAIERIQADLQPMDNPTCDAARTTLASMQQAAADDDKRAIAYEQEMALQFPAQLPLPLFWQWWFRPLIDDETSRIILNSAREISSLRADNAQEMREFLSPTPPHHYPLAAELTFFASKTQSVGDSIDYSRLHFFSRTECAAATLLLASSIYHSQFGHFPKDASDLVPSILFELPVDPCARDHRPMAYRLDPQGPTVWSVGENGIDDGGHVVLDDAGIREYRYGRTAYPKYPHDIVYGAAWIHAPTTPPPQTK